MRSTHPFIRALQAMLAGGLFCIGATLLPAETPSSNSWWALKPLTAPPPPVWVAADAPIPNPIDRFIQSTLRSKGLSAAPKADRRTLLRRLTFDLTGLAPTPGEMEAFLSDPGSNAYEQAVDRLLASARYGERWARHWMDVAHFAETHGHDQDRIRTNAWPYRDYLIRSFNTDKPYARFVQEQVAGDVLFPDDPAATVALGFLAAGPWDESSLRDIREDTVDRQIGRYLDRDDMLTTVMQTFTSVTVQCARCHDHKFDPVPQRDYYALQAVFSGVDRANRSYDPDPSVHRRRREIRQQLARLDQGDASAFSTEEAKALAKNAEDAWKRSSNAWHVLVPETFVSVSGAGMEQQADHSFFVSGRHGPTDTYTLTAANLPKQVTAIRLEVLPDERLPQKGPGRESNGNLHLSEFQMHLFRPGATTSVEVVFTKATADYNQPGWTIDQALDGNEKTAWGIHPREGERHWAVFELAQPLEIPAGAQCHFFLKQLHGGHCIGRFRLSATDAASPSELAAFPESITKILAKPTAQRTDPEKAEWMTLVVRRHWERELSQLPQPSFVYAAASDFLPDGGLKPAGHPRKVNVLKRGDIGQPQAVASPGALTCVSVEGLPVFPSEESTDEGARRVALAAWLTHHDHPLTWRSIVNRVWHHHFGRGLVGTPNDFGRMGDLPTHPELLDWMAVWFRDEAKGSFKQLHRLIVTSLAYQQQSRNPSIPSDVDPENKWLGRMNRLRLDAEQIRDTVLQISGELDLRMGGPSDQQFSLQPGIHVTPKVDYTKFDVADVAGRRRGVYRFLFRTLPDPFMDALDCPAGDQWMPVRNAQVTVQQALALWNNAFMTHQCESLARQLEGQHPDVVTQVREAFRRMFNRVPTATETEDFAGYARRHGLPNLARVLFNANEFVFID